MEVLSSEPPTTGVNIPVVGPSPERPAVPHNGVRENDKQSCRLALPLTPVSRSENRACGFATADACWGSAQSSIAKIWTR